MKSNIFIITLILFSCSNIQSEKQSDLQTVEQLQNEVTIDECDVQTYLNDSDILTEAKQIWKGELKPTDDGLTYNVLLQLANADPELLPFYIIVADKINRAADGGLSEFTIELTNKMINERTETFFKLFNKPHCLLKNERLEYPSSFAQQYAYYLSMACDNDNYIECTEIKISALKEKCPSCNMDDFLTVVRSTL